MASKLQYTRAELTTVHSVYTDGPKICKCHICGEEWWAKSPTVHGAHCPLADASCVGIAMLKLRPQIEFIVRPGGCVPERLWWTAASGAEYHIEKLPATVLHPHGRYAMFDQAGNERLVTRTLGLMRAELRKTQGEW